MPFRTIAVQCSPCRLIWKKRSVRFPNFLVNSRSVELRLLAAFGTLITTSSFFLKDPIGATVPATVAYDAPSLTAPPAPGSTPSVFRAL